MITLQIGRPKMVITTLLMILSFICYLSCSQEKSEKTAFVHEILGKKESCLGCHQNITGFSPSHNPEVIGCATCHLGNPKAYLQEEAHSGLINIPGNFSSVDRTCGAVNCHGSINTRVKKSLMSSLSGMIAVNRFVFNESDSLDHYFHVNEMGYESPSDHHFRQLCASCHLGKEKKLTGPISEMSRGGGCLACHLQYGQQALEDQYTDQNMDFVHPNLSIQISDNHCFGCHSRSGRISTSYQGWHETQLSADEVKDLKEHRIMEDGRVLRMVSPDVHHLAGMECIDCHSASEVMGDGNIYLHQEDAVKIQCQDCHSTNDIQTISFDSLDSESKKIIALRGMDLKTERFVIKDSDGKANYNMVLQGKDSIMVIQKNKENRLFARRPAKACTGNNAHSNLSCQACHSQWAPQCIGCHHEYDPETLAFDHLTGIKSKGKWVEYIGEYFAAPPTLGVIYKRQSREEIKEIKTFISGMISSINLQEFGPGYHDSTIFKRLYAPLDPHTTSNDARSCISCHKNPTALGYGKGSFDLAGSESSQTLRFTPDYVNSEYDNLPQDAWIGFLNEPRSNASTRSNARPFNRIEQKNILRVGSCLSCHQGSSEVMERGLTNWEEVLKMRKEACRIPLNLK